MAHPYSISSDPMRDPNRRDPERQDSGLYSIASDPMQPPDPLGHIASDPLRPGAPGLQTGLFHDPIRQAQREAQRPEVPYSISSDPMRDPSRKASDVLNELAPVPSEITPEDERGLMSSAAEATIGGLSALGNILDIPGSMVRDTLALENPLDQLAPWNWTTHHGRVTGRELLTKYGLTDPNDPDSWEGADFAGFGAEVLLDPLTWVTGGLLAGARAGLSGGGKIVRNMGKLSTLPDIAAQLPRNIRAGGKYIGPREAKRMTLKEFLDDRATAISMIPETGLNAGLSVRARKAALRNLAEETAGESIRHTRKAAQAAGEVAAREAGEQAVTAAVRSGADDAGQLAAREAAERAAWEPGGIASLTRKRVLRDKGGKAIVNAELNKPLGGDLQFGVPFGPEIGRPVNLFGDRFAKGADKLGRYVSESTVGQVASMGFESAVGGRFGKYAQQAMRASRHFEDASSQKVYQHIQGLSHGMDEGKSIFNEFFGEDIARWHAGVDPSTVNRELSVGDIMRTEDMGANGRLMGVDDQGQYMLRIENPENGAWQMVSKPIADPLSARVAVAGSDEAARYTDALVEDALNSFMGASSEIGFEKALDSWFMGDVFDRLGYSGRRGRIRLIDRPRGATTAHGLRPLSPEQYGRLDSTVNDFVSKAHVAADALRDDLVSRGVPIGDVYDTATEFLYYPRRATPETLERLGHPNVERNFLGDVTEGAARGAEGKVRDFNFLTDTALGRTQVTAKVPKHVLERMYNDKRIIDAAGSNDEIAREIGVIIEADPEYSKYLNPEFSKDSVKEMADQAAQGLPNRAVIDNAKSRHARAIGESVQGHRGHGNVYTPDMVTVFAKHASQMNAKRSLLDGAFATLATAARAGSPDGATVAKALKGLGLDIKVVGTKTVVGKEADTVLNIYGGESLKHLARKMSIPATEQNLRRLAEMNVPEDLVKQFAGTHLATQPESLKSLLKVIDTATAQFKANVTLPFASFGMRNLMSGQFVNISSGEIRNARDFADYLAAVSDAGKMRANPTGKEWVRWMEEIQAEGFVEGRHHFQDVPRIGSNRPAFAERGVQRSSPGGMFRGADETLLGEGSAIRTLIDPREWLPNLQRRYGEAAEHVAARPHIGKGYTGATQPLGAKATLGRSRAALRTGLGAGSDFNRHVEFTNRVPMYLYLRRKGLSATEASSRVRDLQFDYGRLAPFEKSVMRRAVPFYAFTRKMGPLFLSTLAERPGGLMGMTIRGSRLASEDKGAILPEYIGGQTTIPSEWLGMKPQEEGAVSFITGLGLAHEDPISYLSGLGPLGRGDVTKAGRRTFHEIMRRTNPLFKGPLEYLTGHSFFQTGPGGTGRALSDMDPVLGRIGSNVRQGVTGTKQFGKPDPAFGSPLLEAAVSSSPMSRYATTLRQLTDPRKDLGEKALNFLTGIRTTTLSPYQQDYAAKQAFEEIAKEGGFGGEYKQPYIDRYKLLELLRDGKIGEEEFRQGLLMQGYYKALNKKRRGGREEDKLRRLDAIAAG